MRVGVLGAAGRMGREVCRAVGGASDLELAAAADPGAVGMSLAELGGPAIGVVAAGPEAFLEAGVEAAVDFTIATAAIANLEFCATNGMHAVCGTTGFDAAALDSLRSCFSPAERPNCVWAPNFAVTAALLLRFAELAAPFVDGVEVIELHHEKKRDAPSGTALDTARRIAAAREAADAGPFSADPTEVELLAGSRGGAGPGGVRVHAVRLPGLMAHEEVIFGAPGQTLTIRQDSFDRSSFMPGVLLALRRVATTPGLTVGLDALLGI